MRTKSDNNTGFAYIRCLDAVNRGLGTGIAWMTALMVLITCVIVVLRYVLSAGSIALQESLSYLHAIVFMLGMGYTLMQEGHVRVDIFYRNFSPRGQAWINLLGSLVFLLPVCLIIFLLSLDYVGNSWAIRERSSENSGLPWVYLLKSLLLMMPALLLLQGIANFGKALAVILTGDHRPSDGDPTPTVGPL